MIERVLGMLGFQRTGPLPGSAAWAREVVAGIPAEELASSAVTFAEQALKDPKRRPLHWAKFRAAMEQIERGMGT